MDRGRPSLYYINAYIRIILLRQYYYDYYDDTVCGVFRGVGLIRVSSGLCRVIYCGDRRTRPDTRIKTTSLFPAPDKPVIGSGSVS